MHALRNLKAIALPALAVGVSLLVTGCPPPEEIQNEYDLGFNDGFANDTYYWNGFFDSFDTVDDNPVYYQGDQIPDVADPPYDSGYNDGLWYAYHDGYYVDYKYAFIVGFSEGYDNAYWPDFLEFLAADQHVEFLNGGWGDGYNDGYSEGRVFGAADFEADRTFDWLDAYLDYESGTDLYFEEIDVGTGDNGPVVFYEHGTNPFDLVKHARKSIAGHAIPTLRRDRSKDIDPNSLELYRPLTNEAEQALNVMPQQSPRSDVDLELDTTWLERIYDYLDAIQAKSLPDETPRPRAVDK